jgi:peptidyl-prolyl cis-trans isomerase A (cyclophilin A)
MAMTAFGFCAAQANAQTLPPPTYANPTSPPANQFNVQMPPSQSGLPTGVLPPSMAPTQPTNGYTPMTLPPSSGGFNNNGGNVSIPNNYNSPPANPTPIPNTQSEIVAYDPKMESKSVLVVKTSEGEFKITLKPNIAPKNVENFVDLALGQKEFVDIRTGKKVKRPFYTGLNCHRVLKSVLIQCGCPFGNGTGGPGYRVPDERSSAMRFDRPGVVAMALARVPVKNGLGYEPNSAGSQFFISLAPLPDYNNEFTVIGQVTSGMDTIRKIAETPTGPTDRPIKRVILFSIDPDLPPLSPAATAPSVDPMAPPSPMNPVAPVGDGGTFDPFAAPPPAIGP